MPFWPDSVGLRLSYVKRIEAGDDSNLSKLDCDVHTGTHIDAPRHFLTKGITIEHLPLEVMIGPCFVAYLPKVSVVTADDLAGLNMPAGTVRLLLRTSNSRLWAAKTGRFRKTYVALTSDAASWIVENQVRLIGIDYLSVQPYSGSHDTHKILLKAGTAVLEGLNLASVKTGCYELICLPIKLVGAEGAPARVVLRTINQAAKGVCL
jgi:arylformamidase